jgi:tetratricopeptide (TPR) repeat protein
MKSCLRNIGSAVISAGVGLLTWSFSTSAALYAEKSERFYVMTYEGAKDSLRTGVDASAYWKSCAIDEPPGHATSTDPNTRGPMCIKWMLRWGEYFAEDGSDLNDSERVARKDGLESYEAEHERGYAYILKAFQLLTNDLDKAPGRAQRLAVHGQLDMEVNWSLLGIFNKTMAPLQVAALNYYQRVWNALPSAPDTFPVFQHKFQTGERLKDILSDLTHSDQLTNIKNLVPNAIDFYQQAYAFHRLPAPDLKGQLNAPRFLKAIIQNELTQMGIGYTMIPGEQGLRPLFPLLQTDLESMRQLLRKAVSAKVITQAEFEPRSKLLAEWIVELRISELEAWMGESQKRGDRFEFARLQEQLVEVYQRQGKIAKATGEQEELCRLLKDIGDRDEWAVQMVKLAEMRRDAKEWRALVVMLPPVKEALFECGEVEPLVAAIQFEAEARQALGKSVDANEWSEKLTRILEDFRTYPQKQASENRVYEFSTWLDKPGHLANLRFHARFELGEALLVQHRYQDAEAVTKSLLPDADQLGAKALKHVLLERLLSIESARGNLGEFYKTLDDYERLGRDLHGEAWLQTDGLPIAQVLYRIKDIPRSESVLGAQEEKERWTILRDSSQVYFGSTGVRDEDEMLRARLDLERGRKASAEKRITELEDSIGDLAPRSVTSNKENARKQDLLIQLAELNTAIGRSERALNEAQSVLRMTDLAAETDLWTKAKLLEARAQLALAKDASDDARQFEQLAPHFAEYQDLGAQRGVEMEIFLADYYLVKRETAQTLHWLNRALVLANELGAIDEQVEIHRKLGDAALAANDRKTTEDEYRQSVRLLSSISTTIPSDLGKVGYRAERNMAIPKLAMTLYEEYQSSHEKRYLEEMFQVVEEGKSRALAEMVFGRDNRLEKLRADALQRVLRTDELLLEYYIPEGGRDMVFRFEIDSKTINVRVLPIGAAELSREIKSFTADAIHSAEFYNETAFRGKAARLGKALLPETLESSAAEQVLIVPAGPLYLFPFSLLATTDGQFIDENERRVFSYLPNAAFLLRAGVSAAERKRSTGFVNPEGDRKQHETILGTPELRRMLDEAYEKWSGGTLAWEESVNASEFLKRARETDNMFLYAHGRFLPDDPMSSYIKLSGGSGDDGKLSAADLLKNQIGHGLWVLAACSTGLGDVESGDEVLGLPRALLQAGASSVVISLWDVDQVSSMQLMAAFYNNLGEGMTPSRALRASTGKLRQEGRPPFDWAPFILIGQYAFRD